MSSSTSWKYIRCVLGKYQEGNDAVKVGKCAAKSLVVASYPPQQHPVIHPILRLQFLNEVQLRVFRGIQASIYNIQHYVNENIEISALRMCHIRHTRKTFKTYFLIKWV